MALLRNRSKKSVALIAAAGLTVAGTGVAFAYWTATGKGTGSATTGQGSPFIVTSEPPVGSPLYPGGPSQSVTVLVSHSNTSSLQLNSLTARVGTVDGSPWTIAANGTHLGCSAADYLITVPTITPVAVETRQTRTYPITIAMRETATNQDGCQNAVVPLYITAS